MVFVDLNSDDCYLIDYKFISPFMEHLENCSSIFDCPEIPHYVFGLCWNEKDIKDNLDFNIIVERFGEKYKRYMKQNQYRYKKVRSKIKDNGTD